MNKIPTFPKVLLTALLASALSIVAACDYDHPKSEKGVSIELVWDDTKPDLPPGFIGAGDEDSTKIDVKKISVWFHPVDGSPAKEYTFSTTQDLAKHKFDLPAGEYHMFATVNLLPPYIDEYNPAQSRAFTDGKVHFITLEKPDLSPEPAYYCDARIDRRDAALALFTPQISAQTYAYYNFGRSIDPQTNTYFNTTSFHNNYGVSLGYELFDGFRAVNNYRISKTGLLIAGSMEKQAEADICLAVMESFIM